MIKLKEILLFEKLKTHLDQIFTKPEVAEQFTNWVKNRIGITVDLMTVIEPSAGAKDIMKHFKGAHGFDLEPKSTDIRYADFLKLNIEDYKEKKIGDKPILVVGNPPFGVNGALAIKFINQAAKIADYVAFILPVLFRRAAIQNQITNDLELVAEYRLAPNSFYNPATGEDIDVPCVAQLWRKGKKETIEIKKENDYIKLTTPSEADIAVNVSIGRTFKQVYTDNLNKLSPRTHLFFKLKKSLNTVKQIIHSMQLTEYAQNTFLKIVTASDFFIEFDRIVEKLNVTLGNPPFKRVAENKTIKLKEMLDDYWGSPEQKYWHPGVNPTVDTVVINNGKILLIKRQGDTENEQWALPGGFVDTSAKKGEPFKMDMETFEEAAMREVKEETEIDLTPYKNKMIKVGRYEKSGRDPRDNDLAWSASTLFVVNTTDDELLATAGDDASDFKWVEIKDIDRLNLAFDHKKLVKDAIKKIKLEK